MGNLPTQTDHHVYDVIRDVNVEQYPSVKEWKTLMETYSEEDREQWQTYSKQVKNLTSDLLISQSSIINGVKSKLSFEDDSL